MARQVVRRPVTRGGDSACIHHYVMDKPRWVAGSHYFYEHGVCKKCGAVTEYLRPEHVEFDEPIVLAPHGELPNVRLDEDDD